MKAEMAKRSESWSQEKQTLEASRNQLQVSYDEAQKTIKVFKSTFLLKYSTHYTT